MLREGSSARNLEDLVSGGGDFIVSDDKDPEDLLKGHVDVMLRKSVELGLDPVEAVKMVTLNPSIHYNLNRGCLSPGKPADIVIVDDIEKFNVKKVYIKGKLVASDNKIMFHVKPLGIENTFKLDAKKPEDFEIASCKDEENLRVITVIKGQLLTLESNAALNVVDGKIQSDIKNDILKISVIERYGCGHISNAFVHGFGLQKGAIASSIAHDSHNIIVVGTNTEDMANSVNKLVKNKGGLIAVSNNHHKSVKLPIAGLMSTKTVTEVSNEINTLHEIVEDMGCKLSAPFMTLSFMALLVIPKLKISDKGLFDVEKFEFVDIIK